MLYALIWKDLRINRLPLLLGVALLVTPYLIVGVTVMHMPLWYEASAASAWAVLLASGCHFSVLCSQPTLAMLSGHLIATERGDRSAEFLAYLPPSRATILTSKAVVLAGTFLVIWGVNLLMHGMALWLSPESNAAQDLTAHMTSLPRLAGIGLLASGAGWCASAQVEHSGQAVALGLAAPAMLFGLLMVSNSLFNSPNELSFSAIYFLLCPLLSAALFAVGTLSYLHRVEP